MNVDKIIAFIDTYLTKSGMTTLNPVQANKILAKAGILGDSELRPGKPLRDLLRKGLFPHAYQPGGKGSGWVITHSNNQQIKPTIIKFKNNESVKVKPAINAVQASSELKLKVLMNVKYFKNAGEIDAIVPDQAGIYCISITDLSKLPNTFNNYLKERGHNILYIGIASRSLNKRLNQELRANGHGTFFRSIGAILGYRPVKGSLLNKSNKHNYKFAANDNKKIIRWINDNLKVNWIVFTEELDKVETQLICKYEPLINLSKNPVRNEHLYNLRKECITIANELLD